MPLRVSVDETPSLNLTSMIDVLFLLILFFMAATRFARREQQLGVRLPTVSGGVSEEAIPAKRVIVVERDGRVTLDGDRVTLEELTRRLNAAMRAESRLSVDVRGDGAGEYRYVASVLHAVQSAGVKNVGLPVTAAAGASAARERRRR